MARVAVHCTNPECKARGSVEESQLGKTGKCKKCGGTFVLTRCVAPPAPSPRVPANDASPPKEERKRGEDGIPRDWEPGDVILDLYEVMKLPGTKHGYAEGGMGRVNLVRHREWRRDLAVKSVLPAKSASARDIENFKTEAEQWVDKIGLHPNIVACHYVRVLGGVPRVFIELVDGGTLQEWIASEPKRLYEGGPKAALERILDVAIQTAWGLHYVHGLGLIHQDFKPLNVMMTADGVAKVTDFGLAGAKAVAFEATEQRPAGATILATGAGMMSWPWCSPEQADIAAKKEARTPKEQWPKLTRRTDIWSWAVSVLEMFLGERPWGKLGHTASFHLNKQSDDTQIPAMPTLVRDLLRHCLQQRPDDRPHDLMQVADALQTIYQKETGQPYPRERPKPDDLLADSFNNRAVSLMDLQKQEAAEKKWQEALGVDPQHPEATYNWGLIQWRSERITDEKILERLREVRVSSADAVRVDHLMGLVHLERGDAPAAVRLLSKAIEAAPDRAEIAFALALAQSLGDPSEQTHRTFEAHTTQVSSVSWSPDGRFALSGSWKNSLWEVSSGKCVRTFEGHTEWVNSVSWSPDGRYSLSGSKDLTVRVWEVSSGQCLHTFKGHTNSVTSVSWSPDGRYALSGSDDGTLRLWEVSSEQCLHTFKGHTDLVTSVSWSPDGRFALSGGGNHFGHRDGTVHLWEVSSGQCVRTFEGHTDFVNSVSWSPDGRFALSGSGGHISGEDNTVRVWEVSSGKCVRIFKGHRSAVHSVSWSPDGRFILSGSGPTIGRKDCTVQLWEVCSGKCVRTFEGHTDSVTSVAWSPDGRDALSGSDDGTLRLWRIVLAKHPSPLVRSMAFVGSSAIYRQLVQQVRDTLGSNPTVAAGILQQARQQPGCSRREDALVLARLLSHSLAHRSFVAGWERRTVEGLTDEVTSVLWSPDGGCALSGSWDGTVQLWEVSSGQCLRAFKGHTSPVHSVSWSPDGRFALSGGGGILELRTIDNTVRVWEVSSGQCVRTFEGHTDFVNSVSWSPDGRYALSGSDDGTVRVWEVSSGKCLRAFAEHTNKVTSVSWSPDGRFALSGSRDKTLRLWEVSSGTCLRTFEGHTERVISVSWSPDGRFALSGSWDKTVRVWEVSRGKCLRAFEGHTDWLGAVSWSPDGRFVLSVSGDRSIRLWEVSSGKCMRTFEGHTDWVGAVSWSPDGRFALSGSRDKTLRLWEVDWEFEPTQPADWNKGAQPFLDAFLTLHTPYADGMIRRGKPSWTEDDFRRLLDKLGCAGYGWLRPEGVRRELEKTAQTWKGPPPIPGKLRAWLNWLFGR